MNNALWKVYLVQKYDTHFRRNNSRQGILSYGWTDKLPAKRPACVIGVLELTKCKTYVNTYRPGMHWMAGYILVLNIG